MALPEKPRRRVQIGKMEAPMREFFRQRIEEFVRGRVEFKSMGELTEGETLGSIEAILVSKKDPSLWVMIFELGGRDGGWLQLYNNLAGKVLGLRVRGAHGKTVPLVVVEEDGRRAATGFHKVDREITYRTDGGETFGWKVYGISSIGQDGEMRGVLSSYALQFVNEWSLGNGAYFWQRYYQDYARGLEIDWARFR